MITFATLKDATAQQVFDQSVSRILAQGEKCMADTYTGPACAYRDDYWELACAAGHLMSDEEAKVLMLQLCNTGCGSDRAWHTITGEPMEAMPHKKLVRELQGVHDGWPIKDWPEQFHHLAVSRNLNSDVITAWRATQ